MNGYGRFCVLPGAALCALLLGGCFEGGQVIELRYDRPAEYEIPANIKRLAIAEFGGTTGQDRRWGDMASDKLMSALDEYNRKFSRYELVDRKRLKAIMDERDMQMAISDAGSAGKVGKIANVDAMIYGSVKVNTKDEEGTRQVPDIIHRSMKTVRYTRRYAMVAVNFTMDDVGTSKTLAAVTVSRDHDSEKSKPQTTSGRLMGAIGMGESASPTDQIVNQLIDECVQEIIAKVSPHQVVVKETLGKGKSDSVNTGNKLAAAKEYAEALECYRTGMEVKPDDADAAFDAGLMLEAMGKFKEAEGMYTRAFELKKKQQYVLARQRVRTEAKN